MDYIDTIYGQLSSLNLAASKTDYSRRWLGMEGSYYRNKLSKRRSASARVYGQLACKLMESASELRMLGDNKAAREMSEIASSCLSEIMTTARARNLHRGGTYDAH